MEKDERGTTEETLAWCRKVAAVPAYDLDVAASDALHVCGRYYTEAQNGLLLPWSGHVWCNQPYSNIKPWVERAWAKYADCGSISMLIPGNRTEQPFWQNLIEPSRDKGGVLRTYFLPKRTRFVGFQGSPPFSCVLLVWKNV